MPNEYQEDKSSCHSSSIKKKYRKEWWEKGPDSAMKVKTSHPTICTKILWIQGECVDEEFQTILDYSKRLCF